YFQGFSCGFGNLEQFPADLSASGKSAGISKDLPADFDTPLSCGFYYFRKCRR
ncbi:hypothetical protein A2U01_0062295, partial [Trifolium medium]|nr:hypothetical protein [Trifolium medium]